MRTFGSEKNYAVWDDQITKTLLLDRTTMTSFPINPDEVIPRYLKRAEEQKSRTETNAEVFTPATLVCVMDDMTDEDYIGDLERYIKDPVIEITCGEAPFLTTRYDATTGAEIPVNDRIGFLDRKLQCIPDLDEDRYAVCATAAVKAVYGYELEYDNLYLARRNLLMTTIEHYEDRFGVEPDYDQVAHWADIISYNLIRMDGISMCIPETDIPARTMNWETGRFERFDGR